MMPMVLSDDQQLHLQPISAQHAATAADTQPSSNDGGCQHSAATHSGRRGKAGLLHPLKRSKSTVQSYVRTIQCFAVTKKPEIISSLSEEDQQIARTMQQASARVALLETPRPQRRAAQRGGEKGRRHSPKGNKWEDNDEEYEEEISEEMLQEVEMQPPSDEGPRRCPPRKAKSRCRSLTQHVAASECGPDDAPQNNTPKSATVSTTGLSSAEPSNQSVGNQRRTSGMPETPAGQCRRVLASCASMPERSIVHLEGAADGAHAIETDVAAAEDQKGTNGGENKQTGDGARAVGCADVKALATAFSRGPVGPLMIAAPAGNRVALAAGQGDKEGLALLWSAPSQEQMSPVLLESLLMSPSTRRAGSLAGPLGTPAVGINAASTCTDSLLLPRLGTMRADDRTWSITADPLMLGDPFWDPQSPFGSMLLPPFNRPDPGFPPLPKTRKTTSTTGNAADPSGAPFGAPQGTAVDRQSGSEASKETNKTAITRFASGTLGQMLIDRMDSCRTGGLGLLQGAELDVGGEWELVLHNSRAGSGVLDWLSGGWELDAMPSGNLGALQRLPSAMPDVLKDLH